MSAPFVGRQRELDELSALIQRSGRERAPAAGLVTGEPGSGKTRLLAEVLASPRNPRLVRVVGFEPNQAVPLAAVGEVIRLLATVPVHGPRLEALAFGGRDRVSRAPVRIFEAAHRALSSSGPLLIGIDDLQWVDEQSLGLIHYLLRAAEPARQPMTVIAAARPSAAASTFRATVEGLLPAERRAIVDLGPMSLDDGVSLARSIDGGLNEAAAAGLWRRAGGSPFWVDALARSGGDLEPARLIDERLRGLGGDAGALLALLAVGARPFALDELIELLEWNADRIGHASRELASRGLGVEVGGTIRLAHDLIREAAAATLPESSKRRLHARLADWIEGQAGDDTGLLREALDHRVGAGQPSTGLATRLVASPGRRLLHRDDLRLVASIADGLDRGAAARVDLDRALGELGASIGELEFALERWSRVGGEAGDTATRQRAEVEAAQVAYRMGRRAEAHDHLDRARALPVSGLEARIRLDAVQADVELWLDHETAAGAQTARRAVATAEEMTSLAGGLDALPMVARSAYNAALEVAIDGAMQEDRGDDISPLTEQCVLVSSGLDDETHLAALVRTGMALRTFGRPREAEPHYRRAWEGSKRLVMPVLTVRAGNGFSRVLRGLGRLNEAHAVAAEVRELEVRLTNAPRHWGSGASGRHNIELSHLDAAAALQALRRDAEEEPDPHFRQAILSSIADWEARLGGPKAARAVEAALDAAQEASSLARCPRCSSELSITTAELFARIGRADDARRELADWDSKRVPGRSQWDLLRMSAAAAIAAADGDALAAVSILESYAEGLEQAGQLLELIWARIDLGRTLARVDRDRAIASFRAAAELAQQCGAVTEGRVAAQALRQLGIRAWRRGSASVGNGLAGLSPRELEVAHRVADGASNREIGAALAVSPKTVERHLTNLLAKLGLRNRTEVASLVRSSPVRGSPDE